MTIIDFNTLAEWFILAIVAIVGAYSIGELANLLSHNQSHKCDSEH